MAETLIIYAHPGSIGHNACLLAGVEENLKKHKQSYHLIDLYKDCFNPVLSKEEHYTSGKYHVEPQTKKYQDLIKKANKLIFIYPVWWGVGPAILKGFFDKVLTPRFAYRYEQLPFPIFGLKARPVGLLKGKKAAVFMTVGSPRWIHVLFTRNAQQFIVRKGVLGFCGVRTKVFTLANCGDPMCAEHENKAVSLVKKGLRWLF